MDFSDLPEVRLPGDGPIISLAEIVKPLSAAWKLHHLKLEAGDGSISNLTGAAATETVDVSDLDLASDESLYLAVCDNERMPEVLIEVRIYELGEGINAKITYRFTGYTSREHDILALTPESHPSTVDEKTLADELAEAEEAAYAWWDREHIGNSLVPELDLSSLWTADVTSFKTARLSLKPVYSCDDPLVIRVEKATSSGGATKIDKHRHYLERHTDYDDTPEILHSSTVQDRSEAVSSIEDTVSMVEAILEARSRQ